MKDETTSAKEITEWQTDFECPVCLQGELICYCWLEKNWYRCNDQNCEFDYPEHCLLFHYSNALS